MCSMKTMTMMMVMICCRIESSSSSHPNTLSYCLPSTFSRSLIYFKFNSFVSFELFSAEIDRLFQFHQLIFFFLKFYSIICSVFKVDENFQRPFFVVVEIILLFINSCVKPLKSLKKHINKIKLRRNE